MSIENAVRNRAVLYEQVGKAALNVRYPKEFEMYIVAFELTDQTGKTLRYFIFPVNPSNIDETKPEITSIKKTAAGISALSTTTFVPVDISLSGNFGRKFKVLLGTDYVDLISSFKNEDNKTTFKSVGDGLNQFFDERVKTGYGCLKILEDIVKESNVVDENGPRRLIFYNQAFGSAYVVKPMSFKIQMSQDSNMIHNYSLQLKAIAPLESLKTRDELQDEAQRLNTTAYIQKQADRAVNELSSLLGKGTDKLVESGQSAVKKAMDAGKSGFKEVGSAIGRKLKKIF